MTKYTVGRSYTVWVDVEADNVDDAIDKAMQVEYTVRCDGADIALNEFDDPTVYTFEALGRE